MELKTIDPGKLMFFGLSPSEFDEAALGWGWPVYRARQVRAWVYQRGVTDPAKMTDLSMQSRQQLAERVVFEHAEVKLAQVSSDGTQKLLLQWPTGGQAECVMIPDDTRRTACISSQVGCPVGCRFCASGIGGLQQNLSAAQIVEQVWRLNALLLPAQQRLTNIVFMGMGEPLANYSAVMSAIRIIHDPACLDFGSRRITVSTVGVPQRIRQLAEEGLPLNLALSLHAPDEALRRELIPWAEHFDLDEILSACRYYFEQTGREITLEYILLSGVNDQEPHARALAKVCRTIRANVNLIRYNEVETLPYQRPKSHDVMRFQEILRDAGVNVHVRKSRGRDIDAACGQLRRRLQQQKEQTHA